MVVIDKCSHLAVVCNALDYFVYYGDIDDIHQRNLMAVAAYLYPKYKDELERMRKERNKCKLNPKN